MPRAVIVASAASRRDALRTRATAPGIDIVGTAATIDDALASQPDVIVVDGRELFAQALDAAADDEHVAVVGLVSDRRALDDARAASGASAAQPGVVRGWALLPATASAREIVAAIGAADAGLVSWPATWTPPIEETEPTNGIFDGEDDGFGTETLTPREQDVLELLSVGLSNRRIAERLGISGHTVKFHVAAIYGKLGVSGRTAAVNRALRRGILKI